MPEALVVVRIREDGTVQKQIAGQAEEGHEEGAKACPNPGFMLVCTPVDKAVEDTHHQAVREDTAKVEEQISVSQGDLAQVRRPAQSKLRPHTCTDGPCDIRPVMQKQTKRP